MLLSFVAFCLCFVAAICQALLGNTGICLLECFLMLLNFPGMVNYLERKGWFDFKKPIEKEPKEED